MMLLKSFFGRITKDFRQKELLPLKLIFFTQMSTLFILYPYLTIHMRELGINVEETAIMSAITPFVAIIMPPVAGLIADRIGNFKILLSFFSMLGGAAALLLLLVPVGRLTVQMPEAVVLDAGCPRDAAGKFLLTMSQQHPCDTMINARLDLAVRSCGYACPMIGLNETSLKAVLMTRNYKLMLRGAREARNQTHSYVISESDMPEKLKLPEDVRESRKLKNMEFYQIAVRQLSRHVVFFPAHKPQLFELSCHADGYADNKTVCGLDAAPEHGPDNSSEFQASLKAIEASDQDAFEQQRKYQVQRVRWRGGAESPAKCSGHEAEEEASVEIELTSPASEEVYRVVRAEGCSRRCILTAPRAQICKNQKQVIEYDVKLTFWCYLSIRVFIAMIGGTAFAMFEGAVIAILREHKADYGLQRIYGSIGGIISSPLSGFLIDYASRMRGHSDFRPAFYLYAVLKIFSGFLMLMINLEFKAPATNVVHDVVSVLRNVEVVALLTACFILGTAWGYIESFLFWLLEDLGASMGLMGMTITVGGIAGIPLLVLSGPIIDKIGHANVLFIGFVFYAIRLWGYSIIRQPWQSLIFEALESVTSSLSFTAAVTYAAKLSTTSTDSSIQGLLGGLYYGVGKGCGSLIGGFLMKAFGTRPTYRIFSVVTLITGFIYLLFNLFYLAKRPRLEGNDIVKKKPKSSGENGTANQPGPEDHKAQKEREAAESREPYVVDDIEAINNAKNLDIIESVIESAEEERAGESELRHRHQNGSVNAAYVADEEDGGCRITVEKEPGKPAARARPCDD